MLPDVHRPLPGVPTNQEAGPQTEGHPGFNGTECGGTPRKPDTATGDAAHRFHVFNCLSTF